MDQNPKTKKTVARKGRRKTTDVNNPHFFAALFIINAKEGVPPFWWWWGVAGVVTPGLRTQENEKKRRTQNR